MLDRDGYRPNVGIILINSRNSVFWGKRIREHSWQFPQGGIHRGESPQRAMLRELHEEIGLHPQHVRIVARTRDWLRYDVPTHWVRREWRGHYRGQKQIWFLLRLLGRDSDIDLRASNHPEFDAWRWNDYWVPLESVNGAGSACCVATSHGGDCTTWRGRTWGGGAGQRGHTHTRT